MDEIFRNFLLYIFQQKFYLKWLTDNNYTGLFYTVNT